MSGELHVVPLADLLLHDETRLCWCVPDVKPMADDFVLVTHHAADNRERIEAFDDQLDEITAELMGHLYASRRH